MGRSQVLYNRTKGRNRNQTGRGGNQNNDTSRTGRSNDHRTKYSSNNESNSNSNSKHNLPSQPLPRGAIVDSHQKDYEHEYELLFAGRDTYLGSQNSSNGTNKNNFDDDYNEEKNDAGSPSSLFVGGSTGSICIRSMAATLESMSVDQRLRIPLRVAATAVPSRFRTKQAPKEESEKPFLGSAAKNEKEEGANELASSFPIATAVAAADDSPLETNENASSNLEDWLDDACGIDENTRDPGGIKGAMKTTTVTEMPTLVVSNLSAQKHGDSNNTADNLLAKTEEEYDDDNLDDWLDSVIE